MDGFVGEIRIFAFDFPPSGWLICNGQLVPIAQYVMLYTVIGVTYGGDDMATFALPDLRGRAPMQAGQGTGLTNHLLAESGGQESVNLQISEIPAHTHTVKGYAVLANTVQPKAHSLGRLAGAYQTGTTSNVVPLAESAMASYGSSSAHTNMMPYVTMLFCIATTGTMP